MGWKGCPQGCMGNATQVGEGACGAAWVRKGAWGSQGYVRGALNVRHCTERNPLLAGKYNVASKQPVSGFQGSLYIDH